MIQKTFTSKVSPHEEKNIVLDTKNNTYISVWNYSKDGYFVSKLNGSEDKMNKWKNLFPQMTLQSASVPTDQITIRLLNKDKEPITIQTSVVLN